MEIKTCIAGIENFCKVRVLFREGSKINLIIVRDGPLCGRCHCKSIIVLSIMEDVETHEDIYIRASSFFKY